MKKNSIKLNYLYNVGYQVLTLLIPLITTPYISRILTADGIGVSSYAQSIVSYFTLFGTLGISTYGQREISYAQNDRVKRSRIFWNTKCFNVITILIALLIYIVFSLNQTNKWIYLALIFNLLSDLVDVTWLFQGMEEFGTIVLRNIIFKFINVIYIFCVVKTSDDLLLYVFGVSFLMFACNASLWAQVFEYIDKPKIKEIKPFKNFKMILELFVPTIAIQIYTVLDKTMIGVITKSAYENGCYEQAIKLSKMVLMLVTSLGTVMIPRIGHCFESGETSKIQMYMYRSYKFVWLLGIPLCLGLIGISSNLVPWFYGDGYGKVVPLLKVLSILIVVIGISNVTGMQYLIPTKRQKIFSTSVVIGASVNFIMNLILIPHFSALGAAMSSVVAETTITVLQLFLLRKELSGWKIICCGAKYFVAGGLMLCLLLFENQFLSATIQGTLIMIVSGAILYFCVLIVLKDEFFISNLQSMIVKIKDKIR